MEARTVNHIIMPGFEGFVRDKYTILPETRERMLATTVTATWRYSFDHVNNIPAKPLYFAERHSEVRKVLVDTFFGPPNEGVYSPSVQSTLYQMAKAVLNSLRMMYFFLLMNPMDPSKRV